MGIIQKGHHITFISKVPQIPIVFYSHLPDTGVAEVALDCKEFNDILDGGFRGRAHWKLGVVKLSENVLMFTNLIPVRLAQM